MSDLIIQSHERPLTLDEFRKRRRVARNVTKEVQENLSPMDKSAVWITQHVGTMTFFLVILLWTVLWLGWNLLAPVKYQFDPPAAFVFWLFLSNLIQILLMPLIMVGQNVIGKHAEARAEHDLEVNVKAEQEIEVILHHLEHQNRILHEMLRKIGGDVGQVLSGVAAAPAKPAS